MHRTQRLQLDAMRVGNCDNQYKSAVGAAEKRMCTAYSSGTGYTQRLQQAQATQAAAEIPCLCSVM